MKRWYWLLRIECLLLLLIYPLVALASVMSLAAPSYTTMPYFDKAIIKAFLWLTLCYPITVIVIEVMSHSVRKHSDWMKAVRIQLIPVAYQLICLILAFYWSTL